MQMANLDEESKVLAVLPGAPRAAWVGLRYEFGGKKHQHQPLI